MSKTMKNAVAVVAFMVTVAGGSVVAHEMTLKGTVAAVEAKRIQIKTGEEKNSESPEWFAIYAKTKILRDKTRVTFEQAKIKVGERAVVTVNHDDGKALEIRLAAQPAQ